MGCGCGKKFKTRPGGMSTTSNVVQNARTTQQGAGTTVVRANTSPYTVQQNKLPAHLQRKVV